MIKLIGLLLVIGTGSMLGLHKAGQLRHRVTWLAALEGLLRSMQTEIRYMAPPLEQLLGDLSMQPAYKVLDFLPAIGQAWNRAVAEACPWQEERQILLQLGCQLGNSDIDGQLGAIGLAAEQVHMLLNTARQQSLEKGKLCTAMGTLLGTLAAILLA